MLSTNYFLKWVDPKKLDWFNILKNPNAMNYIQHTTNQCVGLSKYEYSILSSNINADYLFQNNLNNINWNILSKNPGAINIITNHYNKGGRLINWYYLSMNPEAIHIINNDILKDHNNVVWETLSSNPKAIHLIEKEITKNGFNRINLSWLCHNTNASHIITHYIDKLKPSDWYKLSLNPGAILLLEKYPQNINFNLLCMNPNPHAIPLIESNINILSDWDYISDNSNAMHIIECNLDHVNWSILSRNPNAINLLKNNMNKIDYYELSKNPAIFL
jgi:hypothetical protein